LGLTKLLSGQNSTHFTTHDAALPLLRGTKSLCLGLITTALTLSGCVTTQGGGLSQLPQLDSINFGELTDVFSSQLREFKKLVAESKFDEATAYFNQHADYFDERYKSPDNILPSEFSKLGAHVWQTHYKQKVSNLFSNLQDVKTVVDRNTWPSISKAVKVAGLAVEAIDEDRLLRLTKIGQSQRDSLEAQAKRVLALAVKQKGNAIESTFEATLASGQHNRDYIDSISFTVLEHLDSPKFQKTAIDKIKANSDRDSYYREAIKLKPYLTSESQSILDMGYAELVRKDLLADGQVSLEEVSGLGRMSTPFGGSAEDIGSIATIGYVDLTSASFKNRNLYDFEISFKQDIEFKFTPATGDVFSKNSISNFDFLFVTDLTVAKVTRDFKSKNDVASRFQSGSRQVQNPDYVSAFANYQKAMAEFQRAQINSAIPKACQGWGCLIQGIADGMQSGTARKNVDQASATLGNTPQTLNQPVYSQYSYQSVEISSTKMTDVDYYVIDIKNKRVLKNSFQVNDNEIFNVAYNVRDEDPDKQSIARNLKTEDEVTSWEKRPITVSLRSLFNVENLKAAVTTPYKDLQGFLATLSTRQYADANPTYSRGVEPKANSGTDETIADERFDSVVIIRNAKSTGTGFYVTPELVMTAFHVVKGSNLVELTFYDGTKTYGRVVDHDVLLDLALIKAQTTGKPLRIHSGPLRLGSTVEAIGHPKGYEFTITRGVISAVRKQTSAAIGSENLVEFIQTDTPISPGNSGGPLFQNDSVIGVNDWIRIDKGSQNLNFSVSYNEIRSYLNRFRGK